MGRWERKKWMCGWIEWLRNRWGREETDEWAGECVKGWMGDRQTIHWNYFLKCKSKHTSINSLPAALSSTFHEPGVMLSTEEGALDVWDKVSILEELRFHYLWAINEFQETKSGAGRGIQGPLPWSRGERMVAWPKIMAVNTGRQK